jgi:hypothetical protein
VPVIGVAEAAGRSITGASAPAPASNEHGGRVLADVIER